MKKVIYATIGLCLALTACFVYSQNDCMTVQAAITALGDLNGDSSISSADRDALCNYLVNITNETTTENIANGNVNADTAETPDVKDLVRYQRYLTVADAKANAASHSLSGEGTEADPWQISTVEDFYAFADQAKYMAEGTYAELTNDIVVNVGTGETSAWDQSKQLLVQWDPIGYIDSDSAVTAFQGTFDGNMHTISGIYWQGDASSRQCGLFDTIGTSGTVKQFKLTNSFLKNTATTSNNNKYNVGSISGVLCGKVDTVYSNAYVESAGAGSGGMIGCAGLLSTTTTPSIINSQFDGTVKAVADKSSLFVGYSLVDTNWSITDCLVTGKLINTSTSTCKNTGAFCGVVFGTKSAGAATLTRCVNVGSLTTSADITASSVGSIIGLQQTMTIKYYDVFGYQWNSTKMTGSKTDVGDGYSAYSFADTSSLYQSDYLDGTPNKSESVGLNFGSDDANTNALWKKIYDTGGTCIGLALASFSE